MRRTMDRVNETYQENIEHTSLGNIHHNLSDIIPTASEIGNLWESYYAESMSIAFLKSIVKHSKDPDIQPVLQQALDASSQRVQTMETLFNSIKHPIPAAFGEKDVDANIRPLFNETFELLYVRLMHKFLLVNYTRALTSSYRSDFRDFFSNCIRVSDEVYQKATEILLAKGILPKCPSIRIPDHVDFVHNKSYFGNWFGSLFDEQRPLNALEVSAIYSLVEIQHLAKTVAIGNRQVVKSEKIKNYLTKTQEKIEEALAKYTTVLTKENLPVPTISEFTISDSTEAQYSDKLLLSHFTATVAFTITAFGIIMPNITRKDLMLMIGNSLTKVLLAAKEGAELMIEAGWLEKIPQTVDHHKLIH